MKENWSKAYNFVLKWEGEVSDHPADEGGLTIYGIASKFYPREVQQMYELYKQGRKEEAKKIAEKIYRNNYWDRMNCDNLPSPLDILVFDTAVNMGVGTAQSLLYASENNPYRFLLLRVFRYLTIVKANPSQKVFLVGWLNRVHDLFRTFLSK